MTRSLKQSSFSTLLHRAVFSLLFSLMLIPQSQAQLDIGSFDVLQCKISKVIMSSVDSYADKDGNDACVGSFTMGVFNEDGQSINDCFDFQWTGPKGFVAKGPSISGLCSGKYHLTLYDKLGRIQAECDGFIDLGPPR